MAPTLRAAGALGLAALAGFAGVADTKACIQQGDRCVMPEDEQAAHLLQMGAAPRASKGKELRAGALLASANASATEAAVPAAADATVPGQAYQLFAAWLFLGFLALVQQLRYLDYSAEREGASQVASESVKLMSRSDVFVALAHQTDSKSKSTVQVNWSLAVRIALVIMFAASPVILGDVKDWFHAMTYDKSYTAVLILWTTDRTLGRTLANTKDAMVGTVLSFLFMFLISGIFPGGVHTSTAPHVWYIGVGYLVATILFMMFVNFPNGTRVWCLSYHVGNMMYFLQPKADDAPAVFSESFVINPKGQMFGYVVITTFACLLAVVVVALPTPYLSHHMAIQRMDKSKANFCTLMRSMMRIYTREESMDPSSALSMLDKFVASYTDTLANMDGDVAASWWEHFDLGNYGNIRQSLVRHINTSRDLLVGATALRESIADDLGTDSEKEAKLREQLRAPLEQLREGMLELYEQVTDSTVDGVVDEREGAELTRLAGEVDQSILLLSDTFRKAVAASSGSKFGERHSDFKDQYCVVYNASFMARLIIHLAKDLAKREPFKRRTCWQAFKENSVFSGMTDSFHLQFAQRNTLTLFLCFIIGYVGDGGVVPAYTAGIVTNASLLLSTFVGSALQKNMGRVQGLVIGSVVGNFLHGVLSGFGCGTPGFTLSTVTVLGAFCCMSFYLYLSSPTFGFTAYLFAGFGSMYLLGDCNATVDSSSAYLGIMCATICICIMAGVDMALAPSAAGSATKSFVAFMTESRKALEALMKTGAMPKGSDFHDMAALLDGSRASAQEADKAPALSGNPFRLPLYLSLNDIGRTALVHIQRVSWAMITIDGAVEKREEQTPFEVLKACPTFKVVTERLLEVFFTSQILTTDAMTAATSMEAYHACKDKKCSSSSLKTEIETLTAEVGEKIDAAGKQRSGPVDADTEASLHIILEELEALAGLARDMRIAGETTV